MSPCYVFDNFHGTTWYGSANHSGSDEYKQDEVTFQLAAVDLILMVRNLCDRHHILKDNSWTIHLSPIMGTTHVMTALDGVRAI